MKKTLVAVAALAVAGGAFAQSTVSLTGKLAFAYESAKAQTSGAKTSGLRVTDGDFVLTAVEDLGGGLKAQASMAVQSRGRTTNVQGRDATVALMGGFGRVTIGAVESGNGIIPLASAGAPTLGLDNGVTSAAAGNVDWLAYHTNSMGGFTATVQYVDSISAAGTGGSENTSPLQDAILVGAAYANGPIAASADYTSYGQNGAALVATTTDNRIRMSGSYDLGVAKLGLGYARQKDVLGVATKDLMLGVSAPFGPVTVGLVYATRKVGAAAANKSLDLGVDYALSKRTAVRAMYQTIDVNTPIDGSTFRVRLMHTF